MLILHNPPVPAPVRDRTTFYRLAAINLAGSGLLAFSWITGLVQTVYEADQSRISLVIFAVFLCGLAIVLLGVWRGTTTAPVRFIANSLVVLGLIGTVLGFIQALAGVDPQVAGDATQISSMVAALIAGMGVALYTTLVGSILGLWLLMNHWLAEVTWDG